MRKETLEQMERLEIDKKIQPLIAKLWEHGYKTSYSCQGGRHKGDDGTYKYVVIDPKSGDGWFDDEQAKEEGFLLKTHHPKKTITDIQIPEAIVYSGLPEKTYYHERWNTFSLSKKSLIMSEKAMSKNMSAKTTIF